MMQLGTILPTRTSIQRDRLHAAKVARGKLTVGAMLINQDLSAVGTGGETRYYTKDLRNYAVVGRNMTAKWFEVRADGDYSCRKPKSL